MAPKLFGKPFVRKENFFCSSLSTLGNERLKKLVTFICSLLCFRLKSYEEKMKKYWAVSVDCENWNNTFWRPVFDCPLPSSKASSGSTPTHTGHKCRSANQLNLKMDRRNTFTVTYESVGRWVQITVFLGHTAVTVIPNRYNYVEKPVLHKEVSDFRYNVSRCPIPEIQLQRNESIRDTGNTVEKAQLVEDINFPDDLNKRLLFYYQMLGRIKLVFFRSSWLQNPTPAYIS